MAGAERRQRIDGEARRDFIHAIWVQRLPWRQWDRRSSVDKRRASASTHGTLRRPRAARRRHDCHRRRKLHPRLHSVAGEATGRGLSADHALVRRTSQRGGCSEACRLYQVPHAGGAAMSAIVADTTKHANSYLTDGTTIRSWLLTTDHKRIALLYLGSITLFFFIGGIAAALIRYN